MAWDLTWGDSLRLVLDYLRALLTGPVIGGAVIIYFLVRFRPSIEAALSRLASVKAPGGFEASFEAQEKAADDTKKVVEQVKQAEQEAKPAAQGHAHVTPQQEAQAAAQNVLLQMAKWWIFEKIYRAIFCSQILLLRHLSTSPNRTARWTELFRFYQQGVLAKGVTAQNYPFENYMRLLNNSGLLSWTLHAGAAEADVTLTNMGQEFLDYLNKSNYNVFERPN